VSEPAYEVRWNYRKEKQMKMQVKDIVETLQKHYKQDEEIYVVWFAREELDTVLQREATDEEWSYFLEQIEKNDYVEEVLDNEVSEIANSPKLRLVLND